MDNCQRKFVAKRRKKIRDLNDRLRTTGEGGRIVASRGVNALAPEILAQVLAAVRAFDGFTLSNDPWGEHDFGQVVVDGRIYVWKIDYYTLNLDWCSLDPADESITRRVMTLMLDWEV